MLQIEYLFHLLAKIGFNTSENEPRQVRFTIRARPHLALQTLSCPRHGPLRAEDAGRRVVHRPGRAVPGGAGLCLL